MESEREKENWKGPHSVTDGCLTPRECPLQSPLCPCQNQVLYLLGIINVSLLLTN